MEVIGDVTVPSIPGNAIQHQKRATEGKCWKNHYDCRIAVELRGHMSLESIREFEVSDDGTLREPDFPDPEKRYQFYEAVFNWWDRSPKDLTNAMEECQPLAWEVHSLYSNFRENLQAEIETAENEEQPDAEKIATLKARLAWLPEEPEEGAENWLLGMDKSYFEKNIIPHIRNWFSESPDWDSEEDYISVATTAQSVAMNYFENLDPESLDLLGVEIVEGECPGGSYWAAELRCSIEEANAAAIGGGLPVRFVPQND